MPVEVPDLLVVTAEAGLEVGGEVDVGAALDLHRVTVAVYGEALVSAARVAALVAPEDSFTKPSSRISHSLNTKNNNHLRDNVSDCSAWSRRNYPQAAVARQPSPGAAHHLGKLKKTKLKGMVRYVLTLFPEVEVVVPGLCVLDVHRVRVAGDLLAGHGVNAE